MLRIDWCFPFRVGRTMHVHRHFGAERKMKRNLTVDRQVSESAPEKKIQNQKEDDTSYCLSLSQFQSLSNDTSGVTLNCSNLST